MIEQMAGNYPIMVLCETLEVGRSGFYSRLKKATRVRRLRDEELKPKVGKSFSDSRCTLSLLRFCAQSESGVVSASSLNSRHGWTGTCGRIVSSQLRLTRGICGRRFAMWS